MKSRLLIYIALALICMLPLSEAHAADSIINQYDANGNLVSGDGKFYEYNDANQLVRVREKDAAGAVVGEYFYDHTGQRVKKVENGVTTYYLGKHYETKVVQGQVQNTSYYFADGDRVAKKDATGTYFYHPDHLGGTSAVTSSAGQVLSSTSFLPFGEVRLGGAEKYSYTGKEKDKASDMYNFEARYVSPELRHFTQADIAEPDFDDPQDLNRYAYVGNNPLSYVDPDGHKKKKKAKLSKREKWMIAHGVDPDHDKTSLKKAKKLEKSGEKYSVKTKKSSPKINNTTIEFEAKPAVNEMSEANNNKNEEKSEERKEEIRQLYYAIKNNGTFSDSYDAQDNICTSPAELLNKSAGAKSCCIEHDNCYAKYLCNASSWTGNIIGLEGECNKCNSDAYYCIKEKLL